MSFLTYNFFSKYLSCNTSVNIILPDRPAREDPKDFYCSGRKYKVLWLLHGGTGDFSDWSRKSMIELYAAENNLIVVMPSANNSRYTNWKHYGRGHLMDDYFIDELMPLVHSWFPASDKPEDNYIGGLSMGGYGALKYYILNPGKFGGAIIMSASPREYPGYYLEAKARNRDDSPNLFINFVENAGGIDEFMTSRDNLRRVMLEMKEDGSWDRLPKIYCTMGLQDRHFEELQNFMSFCRDNDLEDRFEFVLVDGYVHEWRFWDRAIQEGLEYYGFDLSNSHKA